MVVAVMMVMVVMVIIVITRHPAATIEHVTVPQIPAAVMVMMMVMLTTQLHRELNFLQMRVLRVRKFQLFHGIRDWFQELRVIRGDGYGGGFRRCLCRRRRGHQSRRGSHDCGYLVIH